MKPPPPRHILVRGVNWLGDAVMTTPAVLRLRERFPETRITLLCPEKLKDLWSSHPAIDRVATFASDEGLPSVSRKLRSIHADLAVIFPNSLRSALEAWLAGIPRRVGSGKIPRSWLLTDRVASPAGIVRMRKRTVEEVRRITTTASTSSTGTRATYPTHSHQIHHYLGLVAHLGAIPTPLPPRLAAGPAAIRTMTDRLATALASGNPIMGLNAGAEYGPAKRWPLDRFAEAARLLAQRTGCHFVLFGGKADGPLAEELTRRLHGLPVVSLAGRTTLAELMAALALCRVVITNDTGPMHLAAALGVPVVVPFGSTSPELTGPGLPGDPRHHLLLGSAPCAPCFLRQCPLDFRCMDSIPADRVAAAALEVLTRPPETAG
ncbi:MAG: lipopolysaccharide heptosyltransferase [Verrucomicrobiota bacterium]|jgi:heptosyltransferase-2